MMTSYTTQCPMIKKHVSRFPYDPDNRKDWLALRNKLGGEGNPDVFRAGGSDVGKITGTDEYTADISFFYHACGWQKFEKEQNLLMYRGRKAEEFVYENYYQYFDPKYPLPEVMMRNEETNIHPRRAQRVHSMVWNPKYEHLIGNIDFAINKHKYDFGHEAGEFPYYKHSNKVGVLELKIMKGETMNKYISGIPENYKEQHMVYMGILELSWGEIFVLKDGVVPIIFPYEFNQQKFDNIIKLVNEFSYKVISVKQLMSKGASLSDIEQAIHHYEPEVKSSPAWYDFLLANHRPDTMKPEIDGPSEVLELIIQYQELKNQAAPHLDKLDMVNNLLMKHFIDRQVMTMKFGVLGQLKWHGKWNISQAAKKIYSNYKLQKS